MKRINPYQAKFLVLILIPMIFFISYFYIERKNSYENYIRSSEYDMAQILLNEKELINEKLSSPSLVLFKDSDSLEDYTNLQSETDVSNLLIKFASSHLDLGAFGIYSTERSDIVFHIGNNTIYNNLSEDYLRDNSNSINEANYTRIDNKLIYIAPVEGGFIYTYHENIQNKPNDLLFIGMIIIAVVLAALSAKWVENRTQKRIGVLIKELDSVKNSGGRLPDHNDNFSEIAKSVNDLKEHLVNEQNLLHEILDGLPLGIVYYDKNGTVSYVNKTTIDISGYTLEEIQNFTKSTKILNNTNTVFWETLRSGKAFLGFESFCPTKDGFEIPVMTSTKAIYDMNGNRTGTISSFIDISEQERLRMIEHRAKVMLDHIHDGVMMVDNCGIITGFNSGAEKMTGLKATEVIGRKYDDIFIKRKTIFTKLTQTLETKIEYTDYKKETTTDDGRKVYLMITTKILWDETGKQIGAMGIYKDITNLEELAQQIQRADKLAVVGELAAGTAHEIRNPLTTIKGFIQLLKLELKDSNNDKYMNLILDEINHINEIIREMLLLAKPANPKKSITSITQIISDILIFMNSEALLYNVEFDTSLMEADLPDVEIDDRQIKQVFINVIRNAIQAMKNGGIITVASSYNYLKQTIEVSFTDQGEGIPEDELIKIYQPFYTTKSEGTGLGIPVSYRIMKNHGGDFKISSVVGKGTTVTLIFTLKENDSSEEGQE